MTLGGLALAVGILVDDATVEIENIHRNLAHGQAAACRRSSTAPSRSRRRRSSRRSPSASCSCRWCSSTGPAQYLFVPLAHGGRVRDAGLLPPVAHARPDDGAVPPAAPRPTAKPAPASRRSVFGRDPRRASKRGFERLRTSYAGVLEPALAPPRRGLRGLRCCRRQRGRCSCRSSAATSSRGRRRPDPAARAGAGRHAHRGDRAGSSPQVEDVHPRRRSPTDEIAADHRQHRPARSRINLALQRQRHDRPADGEILIALKPEHHEPTARYVKTLRETLPQRVSRPHVLLPAGRHRQPDPQLRAAGADRRAGRRASTRRHTTRSPSEIAARIARIPGAVDVHLHQVVDAPRLTSTSTGRGSPSSA